MDSFVSHARRSAWRPRVLVVAALLFAACADDSGSRSPIGTPGPIVADYDTALTALEEWRLPSTLYKVIARYEVVDRELVLGDTTFLFVSEDSGRTPYSVRVDEDGATGSSMLAIAALPHPTPYDPHANTVGEQRALDLAWTNYGQGLVEQCGPLRWLELWGGVSDDGQTWRVSYAISGPTRSIDIDASGELGFRDPITC